MSTTDNNQVSEHLDDEDPLVQLRRAQEAQGKGMSALKYGLMILALTFGTALIIALLGKFHGGPYCDGTIGTGPGQTRILGYLCDRTHQILFFAIPGAISFFGFLGCVLTTYKRWKLNARSTWQPWLFATWLLLLFSLSWITGTGTLALTGH